MTKLRFEYPICKNEYSVIDGDNVEVWLDRGWNDSKITNLSLWGLDAPEIFKPKSQLEREAGNAVKEIVSHWLMNRKYKFIFYASSLEKPKYANHTIGKLWAEGDGKKEVLNDYLLDKGLVRVYTGKKRLLWTTNELTTILQIAESLLRNTMNL